MDRSREGFQKNRFKDRRLGKDRRVADDNILIGTDRRGDAERRKQKGPRVEEGTFLPLKDGGYKIDQTVNIRREGLSSDISPTEIK